MDSRGRSRACVGAFAEWNRSTSANQFDGDAFTIVNVRSLTVHRIPLERVHDVMMFSPTDVRVLNRALCHRHQQPYAVRFVESDGAYVDYFDGVAGRSAGAVAREIKLLLPRFRDHG